MELRATFDTVADLYDAARPGYPEPLFDDIAMAGHLAAGDPVLEVGCGSGQATEGLIARGYRVSALDPGPSLIAAGQRRFAGRAEVDFITAGFEAWEPPARAFKLVAAAQAWHWIAPPTAFAKARQALEPGGLLAVFGACPVRLPAGVLQGLQALYAQHAPELAGPPPESWYLPQGPLPGLFASFGFAPLTHHAYRWTWRHTAQSFMAFLRSRSDFQVLPEGRREPLITAIGALVADHGEILELDYETHLYMAPPLRDGT
ncbi:MAG TPA: class I SAM-dependent methyltransferase [Phenylobacterium sp.]|nr:class I SAM-dependent methyltransferase [Phenylobacterium sp.]